MTDELKNAWEKNADFNGYFDELIETKEVVLTNHSHLKPSEALFRLDEVAYDQAVANWRNSVLQEALGYGIFEDSLCKDNQRRFEELKRIIKRGRIIPFVGAGVSKPCGYPTWHEYLHGLALKSSNRQHVRELINSGSLEQAADELLKTVTPNAFNEHYDGVFGQQKEIVGAVRLLPQIAQSCVITTNFDRVLERAFEEQFCGFDAVINGNVECEFHRAIAKGDRQLLKLHGRINDAGSRVFCKVEYDRAYGSNEFDYKLPLPNILSRVYKNNCLLFIGASLNNDIIMKLFDDVVSSDGSASIPRHFAILAAPNGNKTEEERDEFNSRSRVLSDRQIFPIWYPKGQHEYVEKILTCLVDEDL